MAEKVRDVAFRAFLSMDPGQPLRGFREDSFFATRSVAILVTPDAPQRGAVRCWSGAGSKPYEGPGSAQQHSVLQRVRGDGIGLNPESRSSPARGVGTRTFAGLTLDRPRLMGIVNVTPDSFSDGGLHLDPAAAIAAGERMAEEGADILDIGGESTRPGAAPLPPEEELRRVLPVVRALAANGHLVSIDTRHAATMAAALDAGAAIVNDVTALTHDPASLPLVAARRANVVLMHMRGTPATMGKLTRYDDLPGEIEAYLAGRLEACRVAGLRDEQLCIDAGIGFAKSAEQSAALIAASGRFRRLGVAVLVGASRKSFIARLSRDEPSDRRLPGSIAAALAAVEAGAQILRVHDVAATAQALRVWQAIRS
jgi:dihydropteroate synthase